MLNQYYFNLISYASSLMVNKKPMLIPSGNPVAMPNPISLYIIPMIIAIITPVKTPIE